MGLRQYRPRAVPKSAFIFLANEKLLRFDGQYDAHGKFLQSAFHQKFARSKWVRWDWDGVAVMAVTGQWRGDARVHKHTIFKPSLP